jgi:hypothetical protein
VTTMIVVNERRIYIRSRGSNQSSPNSCWKATLIRSLNEIWDIYGGENVGCGIWGDGTECGLTGVKQS